MSIASNYSVIIIKPDAHKDILGEMILADLESGGLKIILRKDLALSQEQAEMIYKNEWRENVRDYAAKSLLPRDGASVVSIVVIKSSDKKTSISYCS